MPRFAQIKGIFCDNVKIGYFCCKFTNYHEGTTVPSLFIRFYGIVGRDQETC